jgi:hypothetical protein
MAKGTSCLALFVPLFVFLGRCSAYSRITNVYLSFFPIQFGILRRLLRFRVLGLVSLGLSLIVTVSLLFLVAFRMGL